MESNQETWLPIPGWDGDLEVSDAGNVRRLPKSARSKTVVLRPRHLRAHYKFLSITPIRNGKRHYLSVAQAVLAAFKPKNPDEFWIKHRNGNLADCRLSNLRWIRGRDRAPLRPAEDFSRIELWEIRDLYLRGYSCAGIAHELHLDERKIRDRLVATHRRTGSIPPLDPDTSRVMTASRTYSTRVSVHEE